MKLDGNAVGGLLTEVFPVDMTGAMITCEQCGTPAPVASAVAYMGGPGTVLRCSSCDSVLLRLVRIRERLLLDTSGVRTLKM